MRHINIICIVVCTALLLCVSYLTFIASDAKIIKYWRNVWIETAMTSGEHQWLATKFIPKFIIDDVMSKQVTYTKVEDKNNISIDNSEIIKLYSNKRKGDFDLAGNVILDVDIDNSIVIVEIKGENYVGKAAVVFDPSLIRIAYTSKPKIRGDAILDFLKDNDAILAMNASGFSDPNGVGSGGNVIGISKASGKEWGWNCDTMNTIAFDYNDKLLVGLRKDWSNIRDGCQFNPVLIANGKANLDGTAGWGLQPRTAIGQRKDGAVIMVVIDGRQPKYSLGATMDDLVKEFTKYEVVNAAACDGGSSSIMGYKGSIITKCSSPQVGGRYLPNAFIVKKVHK